jgi:toxin ParE1/3/4
MNRAVEQLANFPEMGRPGRVHGTRELVIQSTPYIVAYRLKGSTVEILALLHGARRWPTRF